MCVLSSILKKTGVSLPSIVYLDKITKMTLNCDFRFSNYTRTNTNSIKKTPRKYIYQLCLQMLLVLSSIMSYYRYCNHSNTTNAASGTGTAYLHRVRLRFLIVLEWGSCCSCQITCLHVFCIFLWFPWERKKTVRFVFTHICFVGFMLYSFYYWSKNY
jgi:hypothetical protein